MKISSLKENVKAKIQSCLAPPVFPGDETKTRQAELVNAAIITAAIFTTLVFIGNAVGGKIPPSTMILDILIIVACIFMHSHLKMGKVKYAGVGTIVLGVVFITLSVASLGTIRTPSTAVYLLVIIVAGLFFDWLGILVTSIFSSLAIGGLIVAENMGILPMPNYSVNISQWVTYTMLFGLTGSLISIATRATKQALGHAEEELGERRRAENNLRRQSEALTSLQATVLDISSPNTLPHLLNLIVERAANLLDASGGGLYLTEPERRQVRCVVSYKTKEDYTGTVLDYGVGAAGYAAQTGQPLIIDDYGKWIGRADVYEEQQPFHAVMSAPMLWQGKVSGVIHLLRYKGSRKFTEEELRLLLLFANHAAVAVENTRLFNLLDKKLVEHKQIEEKLRENRKFLADLIEHSATLIFVKDRDGRYELVNRRYEEVTGISRESIIGHKDAECFPEDLAIQYRKSDLLVIESGQAIEIEDFVDSPDGRQYLFTIKFPLRADDGSVRGICGITTDITERKRAEELLEQTRNNYETFFNSIDELLFVLDQNGNILHTNKTVTDRLGYYTTELLGQSVLLVHPPERREEAGKIVGEMLAGTAEFCPVPVMTKSGERIPVETRVTPGFWDGKPVIFGVTKDISKIKLSEEKFSKAFHSSSALMALSHFEDGTYIDVNEVFLETLGFSRDEVIGRTSIELNIFLDENQRDTILETVRREKTVRNIDVMVQAKDGSPRNGLFTVDTIYIGKDLCLLTVMVDITERRQVEEELAMERRRLTDILAGTNVGTWEWNIQTGKTIFNERWAGIIGYTLNELAPASIETWIKFVHPDDLTRSEELLDRHFKGELDYYEMEARMRHKNGNWVWVLDRGKVATWTEDGKPLLMSGTHQDITERKQSEELLKQANEQLLAKVTEIERLQDELREQALRDPLTGLYNRRYLSETLNREVVRTKRSQQSLSIITMDVDHFKKVNDTCGHQAGDLFLKEVANLIKNHARGYDSVCRYGGEEFLMVLPGASTADAVMRADEIRQRCAAFIVTYEGKELHVTISMGVATYPDHDMDIERVIVKADQALYHSKNSGRNRVTAWNEHQMTAE